MLSQLDKFFVVFLMIASGVEMFHDSVKSFVGSNWLMGVIAGVACVYVGILVLALIKHFFPVSDLPVK